MLGLLQDVLLGECVRDLVLLDNDLLLEDLDGVEVVCGLFAAEDDFAEGALAQNLDELKVLQCLRTKKRFKFQGNLNQILSVVSTYDFALSLLVPPLSPPAKHVDVHVPLVVGGLVCVHVLVVQLLLNRLDRLHPRAPGKRGNC